MKTYALAAALILLAACSTENPVAKQTDKITLTRPLLKLDSAKATDLLVPANAIIKRGGTTGVFVLQDNEARFRMIKPAHQLGSSVRVLSGLVGNETLVLGSLQEIHDGSPIRSE